MGTIFLKTAAWAALAFLVYQNAELLMVVVFTTLLFLLPLGLAVKFLKALAFFLLPGNR